MRVFSEIVFYLSITKGLRFCNVRLTSITSGWNAVRKSCDAHLLPFVYTFRSRRISTSICAAEVFFDLFDRKPLIDNASNTGHELVRSNHFVLDIFTFFYYLYRSTFVVRSHLIMFTLCIQLGRQTSFFINFNWTSNLVS